MAKESSSSSASNWFFSILQLILITLKLAEVGAVAKWSWWWVWSPTWAPLTFVVVLFMLSVIVKVAKKRAH